jgi:hypothetical protein
MTGEVINPKRRASLLDALREEGRRGGRPEDPDAPVSANARSAGEWIGVPAAERARVLEDLLLTTDALPVRLRPTEMKSADSPSLPTMVVAVDAALDKARIPHTIGGAIALAYYGEPRMTVDIDVNVFVGADRWPEIAAALSPLGVEVSVDADAPARDGQVRLPWDDRFVDVFFSHDLLHAAMPAAARPVPFAGGTIPILSPEHLVVRKATLDRTKDWLDVEGILVATEPLDVAEIETLLERLVGPTDPRLEKLRELLVPKKHRNGGGR